jgi:NADPH-dependent glutamate synthase beta subunit-like oxidoreductase
MVQQQAVSKSNASVEDIRIEKANLYLKLNELKAENARFLTITALDVGDDLEIVYHFERGSHVINLITRSRKGHPIPSITSFFGAAFLAENEVQDLFNAKFVGLNVDFGGKMLKIEAATETTLLKSAVGEAPTVTRFYGRCRDECPAMVNIPKYIRQIAAGDPEGAYSTVVERAPIPAILGRVCVAPCQTGCRQERRENNIQIRLLKRYAADSMKSLRREIERSEPTGRRVAVVGGGPSGVTVAYYLGMLGHDVTVFEKARRCGGAMLWGIPKYRLPKDVLQEEISARFDEAGVKLETGVEIKNLDTLFNDGFDAVYVSIGAMKPNRMMVEGEDSPNVLDSMDFLTSVNANNEAPDLGDEVIVVGGGNAAIDAARVSKRLGVRDVTVYYRRTETEMPAVLDEIHEAMREGVSFDFLAQPIKIIPGERLTLSFQCMIPGEPDSSGRRRPVPLEGAILMRETDTLIAAIGNGVEIPPDFGLEVDRRGRVIVDENYTTSRKGVWAGGDTVTGPRFVIEAIRDGRKAASAMDEYLGGNGLPEPTLDMDELVQKPTNEEKDLDTAKVRVRELDVYYRIRNFEEVELGFSEEEALMEAGRCWRCDWNE